jgi:RHS repeat-associated protein
MHLFSRKSILILVGCLVLLFAREAQAAAPTISNLSPSSGAVAASVTITGTNFGSTKGTSTVKFNGTTASTTSWSATSIVATVPSGATTGNVVVTVSNKSSNGVSFTVVPAPSITSLSPTSGAEGASVTITGANFGTSQGTSTVKFNGTTATPTSWSATSIAVPVPTGATTGNVVVHASGVDSNGSGFTVLPNITSLSPTSGAVSVSVTITGTTFGSTQGSSSVKFNGTTATPTSWSGTSIAVPVPTGATTGNVVVHAGGVDSNGSSFTVLPTPSITSLSPTSGAVSVSVTIAGSNFGSTQGSSTVKFNGTAATPTSWSDTSIAVPVPSGATTGNVVVHANGVDSNGSSFTVLPTPSITSLSPTAGPVGTSVTITGSNFGSTQGSSTVKFNGTTATVSTWSASSITATVPSAAATGNVVVHASGVDSNAVVFSILPLGWSDSDVGSVTLAGGGSYSNGVFTINGTGSLGSTADSFNFAFQTLSGDGTIVARVVSTSNTSAQAGLMIRETLNAGASNMFVGYDGGPVDTLFRTTTGGTSANSDGTSASLPRWVKLVRTGSSFTAYQSLDGLNWAAGTSQTISMAQSVYIGLAVSSGGYGNLNTATFDSVSINSAANPAPIITTVSATTGSIGNPVVISGSGFGASQGSSVVLLNDAPVTINSWSATSITITIPSGATSGPLVVSVAPSMNDSNPVEFTVTSTPLPAGWLDQDVGLVYKAGNASYANGVFTAQTAGSGFDGGCGQFGVPPDAFHFVYQQLSGDGTIVARVLGTTSTGAQAGVIIRETMDPLAKRVLVADYSNNAAVYYRLLGGAISCYVGSSQSATYAPWVKLTRSGNSFSAFQSPNGFDWTPIGGTYEVSMAQNVYIGLAVGLGQVNIPYTGYFDNVSVSTTGTTPPVVTGLSATAGPIGSQVVVSGSGFGLSQGSSVVLLNDALVTINSWSATSITVTIPTTATSGPMSVLVGPSMVSSNSIVFTVTPQPLLSGWFDTDIGTVGTSGSASYANGVFTVQGAAQYLAGSADAFHFVYQPMSTDGTIIARVTGGTNGAHAGVMMRETLGADAANASASGYVGSTNASLFYRPFRAGYEFSAGGMGLSLPYWVKVVRNANQFSAYAATDAVNLTWVQLGTTQTITTAQTVYVGFGTASQNYSYTDTATYDNVSVTLGGSLPNPVTTGVSPTTGGPGASVTISGSGFGATQGSSSVSFNGGTATAISSWSDTQIVVLVPDGANTGPVMVTAGGITGQGPMFTVAFNAQLTDSLSNQTSFVSSLEGGKWSLTNAQGSGCSTCTVRGNVQNAYDAQGNLQSTTDAMGNTTIYEYDSSNNPTLKSVPITATTVATTQYTYNSFGEVLTATDPLGNVTSNSYDTHGNLLTVTTPSPSPGVAGSVTTFTYDPATGELLTIKDPLNNVTTLAYYPTGLINTITDAQQKVTTYTYDTHGNRKSVTDAMNNQTTFDYDTGDRLKTITYPGSTGTTQFGYDYRGRRTSVTDQNGKTTTYAYDDADRLTSVTDAAAPGNVTTYGYDTEKNLMSIQDANHNTTSFTYDAFGRVTKTTFPSGYIETYGYDADNNLTSKTDRKNQQMTYTYDQLNRLTGKTYPDSTTVNYTYDNDSRLTQVTDATGTYQFTFDNMGRLASTTTSYTFLARNFTTAYGYDKASNRTSFTDPENGSTGYVYDTLNRLQTLTPPAAFTASGNFGFSYDALSRRTQMTRPNNIATNYGYDNLSRLLSVLHQAGSTTLDGASYGVDNAGNRTSRTPQPSGTASNYGYDPIYELTGVTQNSTTTESYTYDAVGNRLSSLGVSPYNVNTSNELTSTPSTTYTYDHNGNTQTKVVGSNTTTYAWDFENRMSSVTLPGTGGTVSFAYDPFGRRIKKVTPTTTSIFAYDGDNLIEETNSSGAVVARYEPTQNIDEPLAMLRSGATSYFHADGLGSVTSLSNAAGSIANTYTYDSFGKLTASSGSLVNPFQYTARESDSETGLYYYRARYYDTATGRFLNEDPLQLEGGIDFYVYTLNNPASMIDPIGEKPCSIEVKCRGVKDWRLNILKVITLGTASYAHCYIWTVDEGGVGHIISAGPDGHIMRSGVGPETKEPNRDKDRNAPIASCSNGDDCQKEKCLENYGTAFQDNNKDYDARGKNAPNSNSAVDSITHSCGITVTFPKHAKGWDYFR